MGWRSRPVLTSRGRRAPDRPGPSRPTRPGPSGPPAPRLVASQLTCSERCAAANRHRRGHLPARFRLAPAFGEEPGRLVGCARSLLRARAVGRERDCPVGSDDPGPRASHHTSRSSAAPLNQVRETQKRSPDSPKQPAVKSPDVTEVAWVRSHWESMALRVGQGGCAHPDGLGRLLPAGLGSCLEVEEHKPTRLTLQPGRGIVQAPTDDPGPFGSGAGRWGCERVSQGKSTQESADI